MTTRKGVTEQAAVAAIDGGCRTLRLPTIRSRFGEVAAAAEREHLSYLGFLAELLMAECDDRDARRAVRRMNAAGFPRDKRVDEFDFTANPNVPASVVHQLAECGWVKSGQPLCLIGDSGTGKSHLLIALGTAAAQAGHSVRYVLASKLVNELVEAADDKQLSKTIARYGRVDLLICDELGYLQLDRRGAARRSSIGSPSTARSSRPGHRRTGSRTREPSAAADPHRPWPPRRKRRTLAAMDVELLVTADCPHETQAADLLRTALDDVGLGTVQITTTVIITPEQAHQRGFAGSPTIFLNGSDPFAEPGQTPALACRVYATPDGRSGTPDLRAVRQALKRAAHADGRDKART